MAGDHKAIFASINAIKLIGISGLLVVISACGTQPIIRVQYVNVPTYIPIPATLTAPAVVNLLPGVTYGDALGSLREGLTSCDGQLGAIRVLTPPSPPNR